MPLKQSTLIQEPAGVANRDGLYVCGACNRVAEPSQREIDVAENTPSAIVKLKCHHCKRWEVVWHAPQPEREPVARDQQGQRVPQPISLERGGELFALLFKNLNPGP